MNPATAPEAGRTADEPVAPGSRIPHWLPLAVLLAVATLLRVYRLDQQVWHDEVSILVTSLRRPLLEIMTQWPGPASHVLFELAARLSIVAFGEHPLALRLPAALFGIAGVAAFYGLALLIFRRDHAFFISALYTGSYYHVWFSQNARGYTAMMLFFVLVSAQLIRFWQRGHISRRAGIAYAVAGALVAYSHPVGISVVPVQVAVAVIACRFAPADAGSPGFPLATYIRYAALGIAITGLLYLPFVPSMVTFTRDIAEAPGSGPRAGGGLLSVLIEGLSAASLGLAGLGVAVLVGLVGLRVWLRRHPFALGVLVLPIVAQGVVLLGLGIGINPRYFAMALPVVLLLGGAGLVAVADAAAARVAATAVTRRRLQYGALALVVLLSALPLVRYYQLPKQDYLGAIHTVNALAAPGDLRGGVYIAANVINGYYHAGFVAVENLPDLLALETDGRRVWLVTTLERVLHAQHPDLFDHIQRHYRRAALLPGTLGDGEMRIYVRDPSAAR